MTPITVLVVEDQGIIAQDIQQILIGWGYAVPAIATSGEMAVQKATELQPDLVLMDIVLKGKMDGIQAAEQIHARLDIPVIFLTAYADEETLQRAKITEPYGYLLKPFKERDLRTSIDIALYKHRMEKRLKESEEHWRALIEHATDIISICDRDGTIHYQSPAIERMLGYRAAALIGRSAFDLLHPQDVSRAMDAFTALLREPGNTCRMSLRCRHKDGSWRVLETMASNMLDHPAVGGIVVNSHDITAQVRAQDALRESKARYRALVEVANVLNSSLDRQQVLHHILEQLARVIDYDSASVMLLSQEMLNIVAHQGFREESQVFTPLQIQRLPHIQQVLQSRRPLIIGDVHADPHWQHRDDSAYIRCWLGVPMIVQDQVIGLLNVDKEQPDYYTPRDAKLVVAFANQAAIAIENTRLYQQAQQDAETKATLLCEVNHRVKNNLTSIIGLLYAERRHVGMEEQTSYQAILQDLISRVQGLATVHGLLSASEWAPPLLHELAERVIRSALQTLPRDKEVHIDVPPSSVRVLPGQAHHLAMVINELATNTAKHTLHERDIAHITVHVTRADNMILLKFQDDGPGYPPQVLALERHSVGFDLIQRIVRESLRGELTLRNVGGAVTLVRFPCQVKGRSM